MLALPSATVVDIPCPPAPGLRSCSSCRPSCIRSCWCPRRAPASTRLARWQSCLSSWRATRVTARQAVCCSRCDCIDGHTVVGWFWAIGAHIIAVRLWCPLMAWNGPGSRPASTASNTAAIDDLTDSPCTGGGHRAHAHINAGQIRRGSGVGVAQALQGGRPQAVALPAAGGWGGVLPIMVVAGRSTTCRMQAYAMSLELR